METQGEETFKKVGVGKYEQLSSMRTEIRPLDFSY